MFVLTCSCTVRSVCFRTSPANALLHISLEMLLEHSYHCLEHSYHCLEHSYHFVAFLLVHSSNSTLVLFCLVTLSKPSFPSITSSPSGSSPTGSLLQPSRVPRPQYRYSVIWRKFSKFFNMSAALRISNNKRKPSKLSKSSESDVQDSRNSSSKSAAKKQRTRLRSPSPSLEIQPEPISTSAPSTTEATTSVANPDPVVTLESESIPQAVVATSDSQCVDSAIKHVPVLHATSSAIDTTSVASNTHLVVPVVSNNPLTINT